MHTYVCPKTTPYEDSEEEKKNDSMPDSRDSKQENRQVEEVLGEKCEDKEGRELV